MQQIRLRIRQIWYTEGRNYACMAHGHKKTAQVKYLSGTGAGGRTRTGTPSLAVDFEVEDRIVDSHIKNIRKKLNADYIKTIRGVGYRIDKVH